MKIGILTLPLSTNYGGILQAYALQVVLKSTGNEVWLINKNKTFLLPLYKRYFVYVKRILFKYLFQKKDVEIFIESRWEKESQECAKVVEPFINLNINIFNVKSYKHIPKDKFDVIVVGSDQIWRPAFLKPIEMAFLSFAKKWEIRRIAYAASFGSPIWEYSEKQTIHCEKLIREFDAISVREDVAVNMCVKHFNRTPLHVLDPVFLLEKTHYEKLAINKPRSIGNTFVYVLDKNEHICSVINHIDSLDGYDCFYSSTDSVHETLSNRMPSEIEIWIRSFYDANFIITDSFHGCVFSILFNKPFIVYGNIKRGTARFSSLLKVFNLESRFIQEYEREKVSEIIDSEIKWTEINKILKKEKTKSLSFLLESLSF